MQLFNVINGKNFINGKWQESPTSSQIDVLNPATGEVVGYVPNLSRQEIQAAIDSTVVGFTAWSRVPAEQRVSVIRKWHQLVLESQDELAKIMTLEQGKVLGEAKNEILSSAAYIDWYAGNIHNIQGHIKPGKGPDHKVITEFEPVGPVASITPWNFPSAMIARKVTPALASGCTCVLKPSELTPFSALALAKLAEEAGVVPGAFNVITGDATLIGQMFCDDFRLRKLSFTGSTRVGKILYQNCSSTVKRLSLELGGNAPFIILADSDIEKVAADLVLAKIRNTGQSCTSPNRIFIEEPIYDKFIQVFTNKFANLKVGNGLDPTSVIGPLINKAAVDKILKLLNDATAKGAKIVCGGKANNLFYETTVIIDCLDNMEIFSNEIFGPVAACYKFKTIEEVIKLANNTEYGLQAYIYSKNIGLVQMIAPQLDFGMVSINASLPGNVKAAFAGRKASGFGVEGSHEGIFEYLNTKYINLNLLG